MKLSKILLVFSLLYTSYIFSHFTVGERIDLGKDGLSLIVHSLSPAGEEVNMKVLQKHKEISKSIASKARLQIYESAALSKSSMVERQAAADAEGDNYDIIVGEIFVQILGNKEFKMHVPFLEATSKPARVKSIEIEEAFRGQGIGTVAIDKFSQVCRSKGISTHMIAEIQEKNTPSQRIFSKAGFIKFGRNMDVENYFKFFDVCAVCHKKTAKKCTQCNQAFYCSKECQKLAWGNHKKFCKSYSALSAAKSSIAADHGK